VKEVVVVVVAEEQVVAIGGALLVDLCVGLATAVVGVDEELEDLVAKSEVLVGVSVCSLFMDDDESGDRFGCGRSVFRK